MGGEKTPLLGGRETIGNPRSGSWIPQKGKNPGKKIPFRLYHHSILSAKSVTDERVGLDSFEIGEIE